MGTKPKPKRTPASKVKRSANGSAPAEQLFGASIEDLRDAIENANDLIYTHDLQGNFTYSNASGVRIFGYTREETLRMNIRDLLAPEEVAKAVAATAAKIAGKPVENPYLIKVKTKDGRTIPIELNTRLIYKNGVPVGVQGIG